MRRRTLLAVAAAGAVVCLCVFAWVVSTASEAERNLQAVMFVTETTREFVEEKGRWPSSWDEIEAMPAYRLPPPMFARSPDPAGEIRSRVHFEFGLSLTDVVGQDPDAFRAIRPVGRCYEFSKWVVRLQSAAKAKAARPG